MAASVVSCPSCNTRNRVPVVASGEPRCATCKADLPWLVEAGNADFDAATDVKPLVVVDLWAPWCAPCRQIAPVLETLSRDLAGKLKVVKVNVDENPELLARYGGQSIPMLILLDGGTIVDQMIGALPAPAMRSWVTSALARRS